MQAFEGIRVLDLTHVLAGPFSTYQLAVLGADVIKIEAPGRTDMNRELGPLQDLNRAYMGSHFQAQGSNKRAMLLDLKSAAGKAIFLDLAREADVIVENFRAGSMARMGLGYDDIREINPRIIYCSITGFGHTGPKRTHGAFDHVIQAYSGMMAMTGDADWPPVMIGPPVLDYGTGAQAAFAIASALFRRERTGEGQHLDVAMLDAALMMMSSFVLNQSLSGEPPSRAAWGRDLVAAYGCYDSADEPFVVCAFTPEQHVRLWRALGRADIAEEISTLKLPDLVDRRARDETLLAEILRTRPADEWEMLLNEAGVPAARVRTLEEALTSDQVASRDVRGRVATRNGNGAALEPNVAAFRCSEDGPTLMSPPPEAGQHTADILRELGHTEAGIADLRARQVI